jgi:hypothetical protein
VKEFTTAAEVAAGEDEPDLVFVLDGEELRAYKPTEGQFALLMMAMGRHASQASQYAGVMEFFLAVLDEPSRRYVVDRMEKRDEVIATKTIVEIMEWMVEEWGGRPTQSPSVSTSSRRNGGRKSTVLTSAST